VKPARKIKKKKRSLQTSDLGQSTSDLDQPTSSEEEDDIAGPPTKKNKFEGFEDFYKSLKAQVSQSRAAENEEPSQSTDAESSDMTTKIKLLDAIKVLDKKIHFLKRKTLEHYISLGNLLFHLKMMYVTKCDDCLLDEEADCMLCRKCTKLSNSKGFFIDVKSVVPYVSSHINFLINIGKLGKLYSNFKNISCCVTQIRPHVNRLRSQMEIDKEFWS